MNRLGSLVLCLSIFSPLYPAAAAGAGAGQEKQAADKRHYELREFKIEQPNPTFALWKVIDSASPNAVEIIKELIKNGANLKQVNADGKTALWQALEKYHKLSLELIKLENEEPKNKKTAKKLLLNQKKNIVNIIRTLLAHSTLEDNILANPYGGTTPVATLVWATDHKYIEIVKIILEFGMFNTLILEYAIGSAHSMLHPSYHLNVYEKQQVKDIIALLRKHLPAYKASTPYKENVKAQEALHDKLQTPTKSLLEEYLVESTHPDRIALNVFKKALVDKNNKQLNFTINNNPGLLNIADENNRYPLELAVMANWPEAVETIIQVQQTSNLDEEAQEHYKKQVAVALKLAQDYVLQDIIPLLTAAQKNLE